MAQPRYVVTVVLALTLLVAAAPRAAIAGANSCGDFTGPGCGDAAGDALCQPDEDCIDNGNGCECHPRVCCKCETEPGTTAVDGLCDIVGCTQTGIGLLACVGACAAINTGDSCNLKIVNQTTCSGGSCPTTGCCQLSIAAMSGPQAAVIPSCVETNAASCSLVSGMFVADGFCAGGLDGTCTAPTPTNTPTSTPTATATGTATSTATATNTSTATQTATSTNTATATATGTATHTGTPTFTPQPDGSSCTSPTECASGFCVDGVCCDTACDQPFDMCNVPPDPGTCVQVAPAPSMSRRGLFGGLALLTMIGAAALWQQRRGLSGSRA